MTALNEFRALADLADAYLTDHGALTALLEKQFARRAEIIRRCRDLGIPAAVAQAKLPPLPAFNGPAFDAPRLIGAIETGRDPHHTDRAGVDICPDCEQDGGNHAMECGMTPDEIRDLCDPPAVPDEDQAAEADPDALGDDHPAVTGRRTRTIRVPRDAAGKFDYALFCQRFGEAAEKVESMAEYFDLERQHGQQLENAKAFAPEAHAALVERVKHIPGRLSPERAA